MPPKRQKIRYSNESILKAVAEVKNGYGLRATATKYEIPVMTLSNLQ